MPKYTPIHQVANQSNQPSYLLTLNFFQSSCDVFLIQIRLAWVQCVFVLLFLLIGHCIRHSTILLLLSRSFRSLVVVDDIHYVFILSDVRNHLDWEILCILVHVSYYVLNGQRDRGLQLSQVLLFIVNLTKWELESSRL